MARDGQYARSARHGDDGYDGQYAVRQTDGRRRFPQRSSTPDPQRLRTMMMTMTMMMMQWKTIIREEVANVTSGCTKRQGRQWNADD